MYTSDTQTGSKVWLGTSHSQGGVLFDQKTEAGIPGKFSCGPVVSTQHVTAEGLSSVPGRGTKIPQALRHGQKNKNVSSRAAITKSVMEGVA